MKKDIITVNKGLNRDMSSQATPEGSYQYALNAVNETDLGNFTDLANEESNHLNTVLPIGYTPIGSVNIGDDETVLFLVGENDTNSEIGKVDATGFYTTLVNAELGFKISNQVSAVYRLRRGCEKTVYWVDGLNVPRQINTNSLKSYQDSNEDWDVQSFSLIESYKKIPVVEDLEVLDSGGFLLPGSINVAIQYLDSNLNPTEWITTTDIVNIYNSDISGDYTDISGSTYEDEDYQQFPQTDKALKISYAELDLDFLYYRLAFIEATNGSGNVTDIKLSAPIPTSINTFVYTGSNYVGTTTEEEILAVTDRIESAEAIEQLENRLVLANTKGKQVDFCRLQRYASIIKADMQTKKIVCNEMTEANVKSPTVWQDGASYTPGEIYSFGICYVFSDGDITPVYHIPGKNPRTINETFKIGDDIYPMGVDNTCENVTYVDNETCNSDGYWGEDSEGDILDTSTKVRHHRFPTRNEVDLPFITKESSIENTVKYYNLKIAAQATCTLNEVTLGTCQPIVNTTTFTLKIEYTYSGVTSFLTVDIDPIETPDPIAAIDTLLSYTTEKTLDEDMEVVAYTEVIDGVEGPTLAPGVVSPSTGWVYTSEIEETEETSENAIYSAEVFEILFSNINLPEISEIAGQEVVGYYIVRQERTEEEKTVLDSAVILPMLENSKYVGGGLVLPITLPGKAEQSRRFFSYISPEHKFYNHKYRNPSKIEQTGTYTADWNNNSYDDFRYRDVHDGTSYNEEIHTDEGKDRNRQPLGSNEVVEEADGWSLKGIVTDNIVEYSNENLWFNFEEDEIEDIFFLNPGQFKEVISEDGTTTKAVYNTSADNRIAVIQLKEALTEEFANTINWQQAPYVTFKRKVLDPYSNFRSSPYFKVSKNISDNTEISLLGGDTFISPMRYFSSCFYDNRIAYRKPKNGVALIIGAVVLIVVAAAVAALSYSAAAPVSALLVGTAIGILGGAVSLASTGAQQIDLVEMYQSEYAKGLRDTVLDITSYLHYKYHVKAGSPVIDLENKQISNYRTEDEVFGPEDDEIQWIGGCLTNLWFESQVNMGLRLGMPQDTPTFLPAPGKIEKTNFFPTILAYVPADWWGAILTVADLTVKPRTSVGRYFLSKLTAFDASKTDSREYIGMPLAEWYKINLDYTRGNKQKVFYHLPLEYSCCSDCAETFPQRIRYSEQAFQEELSDNYGVFLANNYRDLEGETGMITNLFKIKTNLFVHTEEALWLLPQSIQERVTGEIVSFLGTGSFFGIPLRKISDAIHSSGGCTHKFGTIKTKHGVFFISEKEGAIYQFDGQSLKQISSNGLDTWFKTHVALNFTKDFFATTGNKYKYDDNTSQKYGVGFISVYDETLKRIIFTKKDYVLSSEANLQSGDQICILNGTVILFSNYDNTIADYASDGYAFTGIVGTELRFEKAIYTTEGITIDKVSIAGSVVTEFITGEKSWSISYSLKTEKWVSWHSYLPNFYYRNNTSFYSWNNNFAGLWKHGTKGSYQKFYGVACPFIFEGISNAEAQSTKLWDDVLIQTRAEKYDASLDNYTEKNDITFNKGLFYNSKQCTGEVDFQIKEEDQDYMMQQVQDLDQSVILLDKEEQDWHLNDLRDIRVDLTQPLFSLNTPNTSNFYRDKVLNIGILDKDRYWEDLESFRDKFLVIRLIFNNFEQNEEDVRLILKYIIASTTESRT